MYQNILLAVDLTHKAAEMRAVRTVVDYARAFGSTVHLLNVVPDFGMALVGGFFPEDFEQGALAKADADLHAFASEVIPPEVPHRTIVGHGGIYREILRYAEETGADLIVMSAHRPELEDYLLGPNAARVVRHAKTSVLVVRPAPA